MVFTDPAKKLNGKPSVATGVLEVRAAFRHEDKLVTKHGTESIQTEFRHIKQKYYIQKVLNSLFPRNFPAFTDAFEYKGVGYLVREFRTGEFTHKPVSRELKIIVELFHKHDIPLFLENRGRQENIIIDKKTGEEVFLDTVNYLFDEEGRIERLRKICTEVGKNKEETEDIIKYAKRSREVTKVRL